MGLRMHSALVLLGLASLAICVPVVAIERGAYRIYNPTEGEALAAVEIPSLLTSISPTSQSHQVDRRRAVRRSVQRRWRT